MKEKVAEFINIIFGFRKFIIMVLAMLISVTFRVKGYISGANMVDLLKATVISFFGSNSVEHIMTTVTAIAKSKVAATASDQLVTPDEIEPDEAEEAKAEEKANE